MGMVKASTNGAFKIGFVGGERGIGKSSIASLVRYLVERDAGVAGCHVFLGGVQDHREMLRKTFAEILKESVDKPWHNKLIDLFGSRVRQVGLFGVRFELNLEESEMASIDQSFVASTEKLIDSLGEHRKALFLILDDINGLTSSADFANWLKSTVDSIAVSQKKIPLCILIVGLEDRRRELIERQPSLARVFELIDIAPWSDDEVREFYKDSFGGRHVHIPGKLMKTLVLMTGGLPVLAHEIGDAVWRVTEGPEITLKDVVFGFSNAAEVVGRKFLNPQVFSAIRSERYHSIFAKMTDISMEGFSRSQLREKLTDEEKPSLDNFLRRMTALGALEKSLEARGTYNYPSFLHARYFYLESQRRRGEQK